MGTRIGRISKVHASFTTFRFSCVTISFLNCITPVSCIAVGTLIGVFWGRCCGGSSLNRILISTSVTAPLSVRWTRAVSCGTTGCFVSILTIYKKYISLYILNFVMFSWKLTWNIFNILGAEFTAGGIRLVA